MAPSFLNWNNTQNRIAYYNLCKHKHGPANEHEVGHKTWPVFYFQRIRLGFGNQINFIPSSKCLGGHFFEMHAPTDSF